MVSLTRSANPRRRSALTVPLSNASQLWATALHSFSRCEALNFCVPLKTSFILIIFVNVNVSCLLTGVRKHQCPGENEAPVGEAAVGFSLDGDSENEDDVVLELIQENTGRWSAQEHQLFLQGLDHYGKGWKKIANLIKTRTVVQIRTHAQKYFQKLTKVENPDGATKAKATSGGSGGDGRGSGGVGGGGRKSRAAGTSKRDVVAKLGVAPSLKPYLALPGVGKSSGLDSSVFVVAHVSTDFRYRGARPVQIFISRRRRWPCSE